MKKGGISMDKYFKPLIVIGIAVFLALFYWFLQNQSQQISVLQEQIKIQKETHTLSLYSEYKNNIDGCKREAATQKKDEQFIKANCIDVINASLLGESLKGWGKENLLITK